MDTGKQETKIPRDFKKDSAVEGSGRPGDKGRKGQKVGTEPQGQLAWKVQINFANNFVVSSENIRGKPSKGPSRMDWSPREVVQIGRG